MHLGRVHSAFRKGLNCLDIDIDQFAYDIYFFFKLSSATREDYSPIEDIAETAAAYAIKHVSTRWLSLKRFVYVLLSNGIIYMNISSISCSSKTNLKEKSTKLNFTSEFLKTLNQNRHWSISRLHPLLFRSLKGF